MNSQQQDRSRLQQVDFAFAGAASGVVTRALVSPLDLLKIRYQLQVPDADGKVRYGGIVTSLVKVVKEEGILGLWKGHVPAQLLSFTYGAAQFYAYEALLKSATHVGDGSEEARASKAGMNFVCGGLAGCCATLTAHPLDVLRTRLIAQANPESKVYSSLHHAVGHMWRTEGPRAFYRGLSPTLLLVFPQTGLQFSIYHSTSLIWKRSLGDNSLLGFPRSSVCGMTAGVFSKLAVLPLDLVKKRLQVQGFEQVWSSLGRTVHYSGVVDCVRSVFVQEGARAFYKGATPSVVKAGLSVALIFTTYEWCVDVLCQLRAVE